MEEYEKKIRDLLGFYKTNNTEIKFRHLRNTNLEIKGRIKELPMIITFLGKPYVVINEMKIFLEDIELDSIMPSDVQEIPKQIEETNKIMIMVKTSLPQKLRFEVFKRDKHTCQYCGRSPPAVILEVDHIIPISSGGTDELSNLITSCFDCNRGKGDSK